MKKTITWAFATIALLTVLTGCKKDDEDKDAISMDVVKKGVTKKPGKDGKEYDVVDLGTSVLWATCNIGATSPQQYGYYFAWGEIGTKEDYYWHNYTLCNGEFSSIKKYIFDNDYGTVDNKEYLEPIDDAATHLMGDNWKIPSREDFVELNMRCDYKCCKLNDVWGYLFTSNETKNSIFIPLSGMRDPKEIHYSGERGYYWSNQLYKGDKDNKKTLNVYTLDLLKGDAPADNSFQSREIGLPIRPVYTE